MWILNICPCHFIDEVSLVCLTSYRLTQRGHHFADTTLGFLFLSTKLLLLIKIFPKFVLISSIIYKPALVQIMAWHRAGVNPLESTMTAFTEECMRHPSSLSKQLTGPKLKQPSNFIALLHMRLWFRCEEHVISLQAFFTFIDTAFND